MKSAHWNDSAIIITYDDWGGFYDHVEPSQLGCGAGGDFYNTGFRLPFMIVSPYAKKGFVLKTHAEHASIPKTIEDLFGMSRMAERDVHSRDALAGSLMAAFDFTQAPRPPMLLQPRICP